MRQPQADMAPKRRVRFVGSVSRHAAFWVSFPLPRKTRVQGHDLDIAVVPELLRTGLRVTVSYHSDHECEIDRTFAVYLMIVTGLRAQASWVMCSIDC